MVGTDIADLLLKEHRSVWLPGKSPNEANLIDFNNEALDQPEEEEAGPLSLLSDTLMAVAENIGKETERFRELLLFGRKKARGSTHGHDERCHCRIYRSLQCVCVCVIGCARICYEEWTLGSCSAFGQ